MKNKQNNLNKKIISNYNDEIVLKFKRFAR